MTTETTELSRRDRNKIRNRKEILDAAQAVFAEKGYRDASVQEIADRADFAVSTLYALFENKEDLYRQVSRDIGREAGKIFNEAMERGGTPHEKLVSYARAKGDAFRAFQAGSRMLERELQLMGEEGSDAPPKDGIGQIYARFMKRIEGLFAEGIAEGFYVAGDPLLMALALDNSTNALLKLSRTQPEEYDYDTRVDEVLAIFFKPVLKDKNPAQA